MVLEFLPGTGDYTTMPMKLARAVPRLVRDSRLMKYGRPKIWRAGEVWPVVAMVTIGGAMLGMAFRTKSYSPFCFDRE
ncbi:Hypp9195 [Branchiostoma lanceolatum]|uniref:Hypp9195 protein n=2 Tax=Branchiostoma lanceolatum TaxID=7740 RepID=A0A8J9ZE20_BRALA|nr:Hypp9195 [Branchiostoma lanceolatum]